MIMNGFLCTAVLTDSGENVFVNNTFKFFTGFMLLYICICKDVKGCFSLGCIVLIMTKSVTQLICIYLNNIVTYTTSYLLVSICSCDKNISEFLFL